MALTIPAQAQPVLQAVIAIAGSDKPLPGVPGGIATLGPKGLAALSPDYQSLLIIRPVGLERLGIKAEKSRRAIPLGAVAALLDRESVKISVRGKSLVVSCAGAKRSVPDPGLPSIYARRVGEITGGIITAAAVRALAGGSVLAGGDYRQWTASVALQAGPGGLSVLSSDHGQVRQDGVRIDPGEPIHFVSHKAVTAAARSLKHLLPITSEPIRVFVPGENDRDVVFQSTDWTLWLRVSHPIPIGVIREITPTSSSGQEFSIGDLVSALTKLRALGAGSAAWIGSRLVAADETVSLSLPAPGTLDGSPITFPTSGIRAALSDWKGAGQETVRIAVKRTGQRVHSVSFDAGAAGAMVVMAREPTPEQRLAAANG